MRRITRNEALTFMVMCLVLFWVLPIFVDVKLLRWVFSSMAFGVCAIVTLQWARPVLDELRSRGSEAEAGAWVIVLGVFYWAFTLAWQRIYGLVMLYLGSPVWLQNSALSAFVPFSIMIGGFLFLVAPSMAGGPVLMPNRRTMAWVGLALFIGGLAAGAAGRDLLDIYD